MNENLMEKPNARGGAPRSTQIKSWQFCDQMPPIEARDADESKGDYDQQFYSEPQREIRSTAHQVVPYLMEWVRPASVIDVGCGSGDWLAEFASEGVKTILGIDGDYVDRQWLQIPEGCFRAHDLSKPLRVGENFDLAISLEVGEHLPASSADSLVAALVTASPVILFSAAVPGQGGLHHVNEQWQDYWAAKFSRAGYVSVDALRPRIWENRSVRWWYAQNALLYVRADRLPSYPALAAVQAAPVQPPLRMVHPNLFLCLAHRTSPAHMSMKMAVKEFCQVSKHFIRRKLSRR